MYEVWQSVHFKIYLDSGVQKDTILPLLLILEITKYLQIAIINEAFEADLNNNPPYYWSVNRTIAESESTNEHYKADEANFLLLTFVIVRV
jgi:hypothetical protein